MTFKLGDRVRYVYVPDSDFWQEEGCVAEVGLMRVSCVGGAIAQKPCVRVVFDKAIPGVDKKKGHVLFIHTLLKVNESIDDLL